MQPNKPVLIALMGPTASGKTKLAIEIASNLKTNIHNVDSRQIYIDMSIGTAKPTKEEQKKVKHYLIDICLPSKPITLHGFHSIASKTMEVDFKKQKLVFLVGGSGLYLQSLMGKLSPPKVSPQQFLRNQLCNMTKAESHKLLQCCDPEAAEKIHPQDSIRIIRALEVFYATGKPMSSQKNLEEPAWQIIELGLNPRNLKERIKQRTQKMYKNGLVEETEYLIKKYGNDLELLSTIGYGEAKSIINGLQSYEEALETTTKRTNQLAKRQKTWFRNKHNAKWLDDLNPLSDALSSINEFLG